MRVIAGSKMGRRLISPEGLSTRPTTDKVKEALFSIIQFELFDADFLDLFSGSGQMGIEAVSRGAKKAVLVENDKKSIDVIKKNVNALELQKECEVHFKGAEEFLRFNTNKFDIVFLDPPYNKEIIPQILPEVVKTVKDSGFIICEIEKGEQLPEICGEFYLKKRYRYGKTELCMYKNKELQNEIY